MTRFGVGSEDGGEAKPNQEQNEFLADEFDTLSVPLFDLGDGFQFAVNRFDAPAFAVEPTEVACGQRFVQHGGDQNHGLAILLMFARPAAIEGAQNHAQMNDAPRRS